MFVEARAGAMGQYSHNNQPSHHLLYLFGLLNDRTSMEILLTQVMTRGYGVDFYSGDEDNGEMGAWFVLSALGLYDVNPGSAEGEYVMGVPLFKHVRIDVVDNSAGITADTLASTSVISRAIDLEWKELRHGHGRMAPLSGRRTLDIVALGASPAMFHVQQVYLDGAKVESFSTTAANSDKLPANVVRYADLLGHGGSSVLQFVMANEDSASSLVTKEALDHFAGGHQHVVAALGAKSAAPPAPAAAKPREPAPAADTSSHDVISNQERQIQQLQHQLASIRHHAIESQQHHEAPKEAPAGDKAQTKAGADSPGSKADVAKTDAEAGATGDSASSVMLHTLHKMVNAYPAGLVLLVWLCGTMSLLCMVTACTAYMYIAMLSLCCGVRVVEGVDPKSYISASPVVLCERLWKGNSCGSCCGASGTGSLPFNTPKKAPVHTV